MSIWGLAPEDDIATAGIQEEGTSLPESSTLESTVTVSMLPQKASRSEHTLSMCGCRQVLTLLTLLFLLCE